MRAAREEREPSAHLRRGVVESAAQRELLVVQAERVDGRLASAEEENCAAGADELERVVPGFLRADRLDDDVRSLAVARARAELGRERASLGPPTDGDHVGARVAC